MAESGSLPGEPDGSTDTSDKEFSCPTCGEQLERRCDIGTHHYRVHGERRASYPRLNDKEWLERKYWDEYLNGGEIADIIGCGAKTVTKWINRHGIETRGRGNQGNKLPGGLSDKTRQIIVGELLGDGSIRRCDAHTSPFRLGTSREKYRDWLAELLKQEGFEMRNPDVEHTLDGYGSYASYRIETKQYRSLQTLGKRWYPNGDKRVPSDFSLTPLKLRHWFIGDGSNGDNLFLHTEGFTDSCREKLIQQLSMVGIRATAQSEGCLLIWRESKERFFDYMAPLPEELTSVYGYKWP